MSYLPSDADARRAALDIHRSFCVQAPAGSGKTELLTQRLLNLLAHAGQPEEILAFTFTRKAAAEMRQRLLQSLTDAALAAEALAELPAHKRQTRELALAVLARDSQQGWELLCNSQRLRINTIDSFTHYLSGQLPLSANLGSRANISTDMDAIFAHAVHATLARLDGTDTEAAAVRTLLRHLHNNLQAAETLFLALLRKRDQWLPLVTAMRQHPDAARDLLESNLRDMVEDQLQLAVRQLGPFRSRLLALLAFAADNLGAGAHADLLALARADALAVARADEARLWRALVRFLLVADLKDFRKALNEKQGFPAPSKTKDPALKTLYTERKQDFAALAADLQASGLLPLLQVLGRLPDSSYPDSHWEVLSALAILLPLLAAELDLAMRQGGVVDHTQTSLAALRALGSDEEPTDLGLRLDYRLRHILVDEFQDTSSLQFHLLEKLTYGWQPDDGRTLFIVGDGMQSCYAFRNAKVGLFLRARAEGIGAVRLMPLNLQVNFRSDSSVVRWVNAVFGPAFPAIDDLARGGVAYSASEARPGELPGHGVHCRFQFAEGDEGSPAEERRASEAAEVAALCAELGNAYPQDSIAILVRNRRHLDAIVPALRARGLRWNASEIDPLLSYTAISDLFILLRALLNIADTTAWFALLRTPFVGLALADVRMLGDPAQARGSSLWTVLQDWPALPELSADARVRLARSIPPLQQARAWRQQLPLRTLLENTWLMLGGPACGVDAGVLPNIATFFALVEQHAAQGDIPDIHAFEEKLQKAHGSAVDSAVKLQLMTIHKAKGLEFDFVLLPGLDRLPMADQKELLLWNEFIDGANRSRPLLGLMPVKGTAADPLYDFLRFEAERRSELEATRLLYIGVTRAAKAAWLFGYLNHKEGEYSAPARSLLATILPHLLQQPDSGDVQLRPLPVQAATVAAELPARELHQPLLRLPATWQSPLPATLFPAPPEPVEPELLHDNLLPRTIGELVHLGLRQIVVKGSAWLDSSAGLPYWQAALRPLCGSKRELQDALATVQRNLHNCLEAPESAWLFATVHQDDQCELALVDFSHGQRRDFVIDRTFITADGTRWIIDYKSSAPTPGQSRAAFLQQQTLLYHEQLQTYAALFSAQPEPLRLALFFTALPAFHPL
jgi:ATP-dependent exoDNAse (exonuclease V) beta subunit